MEKYMLRTLLVLALTAPLMAASAKAETPGEWVKLGARVHGGLGAFIPLGIKIGLDAVERMKAKPRSLSVLYFDNPKTPCACFADGVAIVTVSSFGQRTITLAPETAPQDKAAVIVIRPREGGVGFKYTIPMAALPRLREMNEKLKPRQRYDAVMAAKGLFTVEPAQ
jgi:formylmethanofuran dehydrogenase subunit E